MALSTSSVAEILDVALAGACTQCFKLRQLYILLLQTLTLHALFLFVGVSLADDPTWLLLLP